MPVLLPALLSSPTTGSFPDTDVEMTLELAFGADLTADPDTWEFTDLSARLVANPVTVSPGVVTGAGASKAGSASGVLCLNDDGYLTPFLAASPYWPYVDVGTPARLSVRTTVDAYLTDTFSRTVASGWGTSETGQSWLNTTALSVAAGTALISIGTTNTINKARLFHPHRDVDYRFDVAIAAVSTGAANVVGPYLRGTTAGSDYIWAGLEFGVGGTVYWTIRTVEASVDTIRQQATQTGLTYTAGTVLTGRVLLIGARLRARAWLAGGVEPSGWTIDVDLPVLGGADGYLGVQAWVVGGNTNTLPNPISVDNIVVQQPRYPRIEGYLTNVQPTFRPLSDGTTHSLVQLSIGGIGSRLERRQADPLSPMARSILKAAIPPIAYWRLEDKAGATTAASAIEGQDPMTPTGPVVFAFDVGLPDDLILSRYGTSALCSVAAGAKLSAPVPVSATGEWTVSLEVDQITALVGGGITEVRLVEWTTPSSVFNRWALVCTMTGHTVRAYNDGAGTSTNVATYANGFQGLFMLEASAAQNGGNIDVTLYINANALATGSVAGTVAAVTRVTVNPDQANTTASTSPAGIRFVVGHVQVHDQAGTFLPFYNDATIGTQPRADRGWAYEAAHRRLLRQCDEEAVPCRVLGAPYTTGVTRLNVQQEGTFPELAKASIDAESGGLLLEGEFGYLHEARTGRYNQDPTLVVDMATYAYSAGTDPAEVLVPKLDARGANVWTVERTAGSSATHGAAAAYRERRGTIADKAVLDVLYDADCAPHAQWRTHLSVDGQGANYPTAPLDLAANPDLVDDWLLCRIGSRVQRTNQPTIAGTDIIDQIIDGYAETFTPRNAGGPAWTAALDTSPAQVWQVGVYGDTRWDSASTTLGVAAAAGASPLVLSTTSVGDIWSVTTAPIEASCFGEQFTVGWMSNVGSVAQIPGGFEDGVAAWTAAGGTAVQSTVFAHAGTASAQLTVSGSPVTCSLFNTTQWPVTVGASYTAVVWVYATVTVNNVRPAISWYTAGGTFVGTSGGSTVTLTGGVWTMLTLSATAPGTAGSARVNAQLTTSPANGTVIYVDDMDLIADAASTSSAGPYVQRAWVARATNGVPKDLPAGEAVHVFDAGTWAL